MIPSLYAIDTLVIVGGLLLLLLVTNEAGFRLGRRHGSRGDEGARTQNNAIQAALLGLLALLLGFNFNLSLQRLDGRANAVLDEANAIAAAHLHTGMLDEPWRGEARQLLGEYVATRLEAAEVDLADEQARRGFKATAAALHERLWSSALAAGEAAAKPSRAGLYTQALHGVIEAYNRRDAVLARHVPEAVVLLLFTVFLVAGSVLGYAAGYSGARPLLATVALAALLSLVIFIIVDLDRPRRGLIRVDQRSMVDVQRTIQEQG